MYKGQSSLKPCIKKETTDHRCFTTLLSALVCPRVKPKQMLALVGNHQDKIQKDLHDNLSFQKSSNSTFMNKQNILLPINRKNNENNS